MASAPGPAPRREFSPDVACLDLTHVTVRYRDDGGAETSLTAGLHLELARNSTTGGVTATPLAMPAAPGTVCFERETPAINTVDFADLAGFSSTTHTLLANACALRDAELRRKAARALGMSNAEDVYDAGGLEVRNAAAGTTASSLVNKAQGRGPCR